MALCPLLSTSVFSVALNLVLFCVCWSTN